MSYESSVVLAIVFVWRALLSVSACHRVPVIRYEQTRVCVKTSANSCAFLYSCACLCIDRYLDRCGHVARMRVRTHTRDIA